MPGNIADKTKSLRTKQEQRLADASPKSHLPSHLSCLQQQWQSMSPNHRNSCLMNSLELPYRLHLQHCILILNHFEVSTRESAFLYVISYRHALKSYGFIRLWHQLTQKLFQFFDEPQSAPYRVDVFERFVRDFESKINQLRLVEMGVKVSKDIDSASQISMFLFLETYAACQTHKLTSPSSLPSFHASIPTNHKKHMSFSWLQSPMQN